MNTNLWYHSLTKMKNKHCIERFKNLDIRKFSIDFLKKKSSICCSGFLCCTWIWNLCCLTDRFSDILSWKSDLNCQNFDFSNFAFLIFVPWFWNLKFFQPALTPKYFKDVDYTNRDPDKIHDNIRVSFFYCENSIY